MDIVACTLPIVDESIEAVHSVEKVEWSKAIRMVSGSSLSYQKGVGIVPSNYYCVLETLTFYTDISFYISLCMCYEMIVCNP